MTAVVDQVLITEPGVYALPADVYHADPVAGGSLSSSGAKKLLACPARFDYDRRHPKPPSRVFDLGHAAHELVLGVGPGVRIVEADNWLTKAAKEAKAEAHAAGKTPVLAREWDQVEAMRDALQAHYAGALFRNGVAEQALVWLDERTGVWCRAMLDYRRGPWIADYKTTASANPTDLDDAVARYGYDIQAAWYLDGARRLGLDDGHDLAFMFVAQEKEPPYLVTAYRLDGEYLAIGAAKAARAREMFRDCQASGVWPGYPGTDDIITIAPPRWVRNQHEEYL
jgi:hypothetical protein